VVNREELPEIRTRHTVLSTRLKAGSSEIRVLSDTQPEGMQPATPELEDVYFSTLIAHNLKDNLE
jgi:ABC-2 type transport system ATP-binding protein